MRKIRILVSCLFLSTSYTSYGWWMWTPGGHVDDSTQTSFDYGYHPEQPLPFSHKLHAGKREIPCQFCHTAAKRSHSAGIPSMELCMGCHKYVHTDSEPIQLLTTQYEKQEPLRWTKVNDLPDYVRFSHQPHILAKDHAGKLLLGENEDQVCVACHGPVKEMDTYAQWTPLQMGWCITCHNTEREVPITVNAGSTNVELKTYAPVTCATCHY